MIMPTGTSGEISGNASPEPPNSGSSATAPSQRTAPPAIATAYQIGLTRQMTIRRSSARIPARPPTAPVTIIAAIPGIQPISSSSGNGI